MGPVRTALAPLQSPQSAAASSPQRQQQKRQASSFTSYRLLCVKGSCLEPRPCVLVQVQLPPGHPIYSIRTPRDPQDARAVRKAKDERTAFWSTRGKGMLPQVREELLAYLQMGWCQAKW